MADGIYNRGKFLVLSGLNPVADDLRTLLVTTAYTFNPDHNFVSEVTASELSGGGYTRVALTGEAVTEDDATDTAKFAASNIAYAAITAGQTVGGVILYKHNAADGAAELLFFYDVTDTPTNGGTITFNVNANGLWRA